ncbi:hypothetical protein [Bacillus mycoides]|uniref:hypothetical protein n=1 Tax=Bacillus mycoides TaxID=1405 RepID=UPI001C0119BC|nr:hypothetical protein [Bacillus mycoides]QWH54348.1 hypothetical protein EXW44_30445 [Bacillus mycoides]QWJ03939.1 hypothetical protein J5V93_29870 [Bacillus mycoides]
MNKLNREQNLQSDKEKGVSKKDDKHLLDEPYCCIVWRQTEYDDRTERNLLYDLVLEGERSAMEAECKSYYDKVSGADTGYTTTMYKFDDCALADDIRSNPTVSK